MKEKIFKAYFNALLIVITCSLSLNTEAQTINVSSGMGHSTFFDLKENSLHHYANYGGGDKDWISYKNLTSVFGIGIQMEFKVQNKYLKLVGLLRQISF